MRVSIARTVLLALALTGVQCARIAGLGEGNADSTQGSDSGVVGSSSDPNVTIEPLSFDFGTGACGTEVKSPKLLNIHNTGSAPLDYAVQVPANSGIRIDGALTGSVAAKSTVTLQVFMTPLLADANGADVVVTAGAAFETVHIGANGTGPTMELAPGTIAFGEVRKEDGSQPVTVQVTNHGNAELDVASFTSSNIAFVVGKLAAVPVGGTMPLTVQLAVAAMDDPGVLDANITPDATGICGIPPILKVSGKRVTSDILVSAVDWGDQPCATTPAPKTLTISNFTDQVISYSIQQATPSAFVITPDGKPIPASDTKTATTGSITVAPNQLTALAEINEMLGITLNGTDATQVHNLMKTTTLHMRPHGVILQITPPTVTFNNTGTQSFTIKNAGNDNVFLAWTVLVGNPNPWQVSGLPPFLAGGQSATSGTITYKATNGTQTSVVEAAQPPIAAAPECSPFGMLNATGKGP